MDGWNVRWVSRESFYISHKQYILFSVGCIISFISLRGFCEYIVSQIRGLRPNYGELSIYHSLHKAHETALSEGTLLSSIVLFLQSPSFVILNLYWLHIILYPDKILYKTSLLFFILRVPKIGTLLTQTHTKLWTMSEANEAAKVCIFKLLNPYFLCSDTFVFVALFP